MQGKWLYLEPIFGSDEIIRQIPTEGAAFRDMDAIWRSIMATVKEQPLILQASQASRLLQLQPPPWMRPPLAWLLPSVPLNLCLRSTCACPHQACACQTYKGRPF